MGGSFSGLRGGGGFWIEHGNIGRKENWENWDSFGVWSIGKGGQYLLGFGRQIGENLELGFGKGGRYPLGYSQALGVFAWYCRAYRKGMSNVEQAFCPARFLLRWFSLFVT
jgi:hypothetical protein